LERRPYIVVGSGPAGAATALYLERSNPSLAADGLILEKATHPREKVCAGGLIPHTIGCLEELGVGLSVPHALVTRAHVRVPGHHVDFRGMSLCWVIRRNEFDYSLVQACTSRGIEVRQGTKVLRLERADGGIRVFTETGEYQTPMLVGADGSGSIVRRQLMAGGKETTGKATMYDVPAGDTGWDGFEQRRYEFDFTPMDHGVRGYSWAFPCLIDGTPHVNVGVYSSAARGMGARLQAALGDIHARIGGPVGATKSFPIRWYTAGAEMSAPHVLLVGDAAGVDPLMGEGISFAFEYGRRAARAVERAATGDFAAHAWYESEVKRSWMGRKLRRLRLGERLFYGRSSRLWFEIAARSRFAQDIGIRWYNGVDDLDRHGLRSAVWAWLRGDLHLTPKGADG
jgi:flavin-dependent dehydrogenase